MDHISELPGLITEQISPGSIIYKRYEIIRLIGSGGMASVYLACDHQMDLSKVAIKVLHRQFISEKSYIERFVREAQVMTRIEHPNIVRTYDFGQEQGRIFLVMEYIRGQSLEELTQTQTITEIQTANLIVQICQGLKAIHEIEIIHRDLKPGNILIMNDGNVKLTDFGIAREKKSNLTRKNQTVGAVCYIAPEVWTGETPTPAVDFYSLGIVLYQLTTGALPFEDSNIASVREMHLNAPVPPPIQSNNRVPAWLNQLILKLLDKSPKDRPKCADEIIEYVNASVSESQCCQGTAEDIQGRILPSESENRNQLKSSTKVDLAKPQKRPRTRKRNKTYVLQLNATEILDQEEEALKSQTQAHRRRRATAAIIPLPRDAAFVFEIERPSRDFIYFGVFLISLQIFDGILTSIGISRWGIQAEGNFILRELMLKMTVPQAIVLAKTISVILVVVMTVIAKRVRWIKDLIGFLSCLYLFSAIIPWLYLLLVRQNLIGM